MAAQIKNIMLLLLIFMAISIGHSITNTSITITNSLPLIGNFSTNSTIDVYDSTTNKTLWCNATITDSNGRDDIRQVNATFWNPAVTTEIAVDNDYSHYTNASCLLANISTNSKNASCYFNLILSYPTPGTWTCKIYAFDSLSSTFSNSTIYVHKCGDGLCNYGENCTTCPNDCGVCGTTPLVTWFSPSLLPKKTNKTSIVVPEQPVQKKSEYEPQPVQTVCGDRICSATEDCGNCASDCGTCPAAPPVLSSESVITPLQGGIFTIAVLGTLGLSLYISRKFSQASRFKRRK